MHAVISATWGPTDPTRAMLPFLFAASALQDGDTVTLMLFHDAVYLALQGAGAQLVPVSPPPTDPTRAMLPFLFAASALQDGDTVTLMLFHDAVYLALQGAGAQLVPVSPPNGFEAVAAHPNATLWACRPCVEVRGLASDSLDPRIRLGGMNDLHVAAKRPDAKLVSF